MTAPRVSTWMTRGGGRAGAVVDMARTGLEEDEDADARIEDITAEQTIYQYELWKV